MIILIDNFDSFTYNLWDYLTQCDIEVRVKKNTASYREVSKLNPKAIVLSPGPNRPEDSNELLPIIDHFHKKIPLLGICLGHQAMGTYFGAELIKSIDPRHGKITPISIMDSEPIFTSLPNPCKVVRYNSLTLNKIPDDFMVTASSLTYNDVMAIRHKNLPLIGLQFHPEAILTENGLKMLYNWKLSDYGQKIEPFHAV